MDGLVGRSPVGLTRTWNVKSHVWCAAIRNILNSWIFMVTEMENLPTYFWATTSLALKLCNSKKRSLIWLVIKTSICLTSRPSRLHSHKSMKSLLTILVNLSASTPRIKKWKNASPQRTNKTSLLSQSMENFPVTMRWFNIHHQRKKKTIYCPS
jgi:hypothetical protein